MQLKILKLYDDVLLEVFVNMLKFNYASWLTHDPLL